MTTPENLKQRSNVNYTYTIKIAECALVKTNANRLIHYCMSGTICLFVLLSSADIVQKQFINDVYIIFIIE